MYSDFMFAMLHDLFHLDLAANLLWNLRFMTSQLLGDVSTCGREDVEQYDLACLLAWIPTRVWTLMLAAFLRSWTAFKATDCHVQSCRMAHIRTGMPTE